MKKFVSFALAFAALCSPVCAEAPAFDFSGLTLDQLISIQQQITSKMWETDEWQEVEVPVGVYRIGQDIPAGHWTISRKSRSTMLVWGSALDESKTDIASGCTYSYELVDGDNISSVSWELTEGSYLVINNAPAVFTPFAGITLGFK